MDLDKYSFHDALLLEVKENPREQKLDFLIDFPVDWNNNHFEKRILRFKDVVLYSIDEIPFNGQQTITNILNKGTVKRTIGSGRNQIEIIRQRIEIQTNAGNRTIEFSDCDFIEQNEK